jgi:hypothetical protein
MSKKKPLRAVDLQFVQLMTQQIRAGVIRDVGSSVFAVWVVIRAFARNKDGRSYVTSRELGEATGLSQPTVRKAVEVLVERSLVQVFTDGSKKRYFVVDHLPYLDLKGSDLEEGLERLVSGENTGKIVVRYVPSEAAAARRQIEKWSEEDAPVASPLVQVVPAQVVAQQVVKEAYIDTLYVRKVVEVGAEVEVQSDEAVGPYTERLQRLQQLRESQIEADQAAARVPVSRRKK